ncbi:MAG: cyclic nucleotide-binding domain-containing protein [Bradyrhizobiaceae bacterium]|nr:MAG: cyclic nucleotide-binding domain-containing protein [Bradyrhizobiaceae bacterium]
MADENATVGNGEPALAALYPRHEQMFPTLTPREIARMRAFGEVRQYKSGEALFTAGKKGPGMFVILAGHVAITQRDGLDNVTPIAEQGPGQFLAELAQLSGRPALVDGYAEGDVEVLVIPSDRLRALLIAEAELGERIMRALILRRVGLIQGGHTGPVLIGAAGSGDVMRLQGFMSRNGYPYHLLDPASDKDAADFIARHSARPEDLPLIVTPGGTVLRNPSETELARAMGMIGDDPGDKIYDVAVVGSGPAGLSTAVYAGSEGLSVAVLDTRAFGGQAGASARIENYLGFPTGISGLALTARAFNQAQKFGAEMMIPVEVRKLVCGREDGLFGLQLDTGGTLLARSVVIASGARYRRPKIENLDKFEGRGVWYWASPLEAKLCAQQEVVLVGGGNSAGQAAVFLSSHAERVRMMIRGDGLAASMSRYLIDRIAATPNIEVLTQTEIFALSGEDNLEKVCWRNSKTGEETKADIRNVFMFVGADPATGWLNDCGVDLDRSGFVITGRLSGEDLYRGVSALETSIAGVFAVGDVRAGSIKRVGGAIGEGAQVVAALHGFLDEARTSRV